MAINTTTQGGNTTVTITYTAANQRMSDTLVDAAHYLWDRGFGDHGEGVTFDSLTNVQKLDLIDTYVKRVILDAAKAYHLVVGQDTARTTAQTDNQTRYI